MAATRRRAMMKVKTNVKGGLTSDVIVKTESSLKIDSSAKLGW
jgi:hypothetical protein